jgi:glycerol kinase
MSTRDGEEDLAWLAGELSAIRRELLPPGESRALYLALDQGGTSSRAVLFDALGREVATAHVPINTRRSGDDRVEHDAAELLQSLRTAAHDVCESPLAAGRPVVAAGLATQRSTICCWDRTNGEPLSPALSWQDRRNASWLHEHLGARSGWVRELTGLPLSPHYGASKIRWCLDELPAVRLALRDGRLCAGPLASFLVQGLCAGGEACTDPANASRTLLFDPAILDWSPPLLEAFDIPVSVLPRCVGTRHDFGTITIDAARHVPLLACSGDQSAAVFAFGPPMTATAYVNAGTGAFVQRVLRDGAGPAPRGLLKSVLYARTDDAAGALHCHEGTVNGAYAALEWLGKRVGIDVRRALTTLSASLAGGDVPLLFMNGVGGLGAPYWVPGFQSEFLPVPGGNVSAEAATELQQVGAVVESIAFLVAMNVLAMHRAAPLQRLTITGGLAACDYLCEVLAEATQMTVERPAALEATSRGIAYLAAGQPQDWLPVPIEKSFAPSGRHPIADRFGHWRVAMSVRAGAEQSSAGLA